MELGRATSTHGGGCHPWGHHVYKKTEVGKPQSQEQKLHPLSLDGDPDTEVQVAEDTVRVC